VGAAIFHSIYLFPSWWRFILILVAMVGLCIGLALKYGDDFFLNLRKWLSW